MSTKRSSPYNLQQGVSTIKSTVANMPSSPGIYKMIDSQDKILYIGKAKNLPKRVSSYANFEKLSNRLKRMISQISKIDYIATGSEAEALLLEANLIKNIKPVYNICLKDDKSFPYILFVEDHEFPRVTKYRGNKALKGSYFGPFASAFQVKIALIELQKVFQIRPCSNAYFASRQRPCIQHEIKRCSAPCVGKINAIDYKKSLNLAKDFLGGKSTEVHKKLFETMEAYSSNMEYERAAFLRDRIKILTAIQAKNTFADMKSSDVDLIAVAKKHDTACIQLYFIRGGKNFGNKSYFQNGICEIGECKIIETFIGQFYQVNHPPKQIFLSHDCKAREVLQEALSLSSGNKVKVIANSNNQRINDLINFAQNNANQTLDKHLKERIKHEGDLAEVGKLFKIKDKINRIEVYDNSHISGTHAVGCMVVYTEEGFTKNHYRKFNIKTTDEADDYAMLKEVLTRRIKRIDESNYPSLMLIDGGKGHMTTALEVLKALKQEQLNVVCISKGPDRNAGREHFHLKDGTSFQLNVKDKVLNFLQILRDEVHRYAIKTHRDKRSKDIKRSNLDLVPHIGVGRKRALLRHFGSYEGVMQASIIDLTRVNGISKLIAEKIFNYLHSVSTD